MNKPKRKDDYLKTPGYPGGKKAFQEFVSKNIRYPKEAREAGIEGDVIVGYQVTDNGVVLNPHIIKGLGHGCDEEALRITALLRYDKVKNKKVRVRVTTKTTIHFRLPKIEINYTVTIPAKPPGKEGSTDPGNSGTNYNYTLDLH